MPRYVAPEELESEYWEQQPQGVAADVIERWCFSTDRVPAPPIRVLPDGGVSLLFSAQAPGEAWDATVFGSTTRVSVAHHPEPRLQIQAQLVPGAARSVLGGGLREMRDRAAPLRDLWGRRTDRLLSDLGRATSWLERQTAIERALASGDHARAPISQLVRAAAQRARETRGRMGVGELCAALGVYPRQLERAFADGLGIPPKLFARIVRFRAAREAVRSGTPCARIAIWAGYSDQAHMTREFRAFAGVPPSRLATRVAYVQAEGAGGS